jgi:pimeloyl-ACP methyl ester carboxylesterase
MMMSEASSKPTVPNCSVARTIIFLHGWPFNSLSFRKLRPLLLEDFNAYFLDWPGLGASILDPKQSKNINFSTLAQLLKEFLSHISEEQVIIVAHDTGATIARLALSTGVKKVSHLICLSTELPGHHLALVPRLQRLFKIPMMPQLYSQLLRSGRFITSRHGFGECVYDLCHLDESFVESFVSPIVNDTRKRDGLIAYLNGIDWRVVDRLHEIQAKITQPTAMIRGVRDRIFPAELVRAASSSFPHKVSFYEVAEAGFLALEERPQEIAHAIRDFLAKTLSKP